MTTPTKNEAPRPWVVKRDGKELGRFATEQEAWAYLHNTQSGSVQWATSHEGYAIIEEMMPAPEEQR